MNHGQALEQMMKAIRVSKAPQYMSTRVIAVDGLGGSGKSSLSDWLARELDALVVHTDDFASWDNPTEWWPELLQKVLKPIAAGQPARYIPNSWGGPARPEITIEPSDFLIVEGVTSSREAFRPYLAYSIWVETPRELRLQRGLERDGETMREQWDKWMQEEDEYVAAERPDQHADLVVPGDMNWWTKAEEAR